MGEIIKGKFGEPKKEISEQTPEAEKLEDQKAKSLAQATRAEEAAVKGDERAKGYSELSKRDNVSSLKRMEEYIAGLKKRKLSREVLATTEQFWLSLSTEDLIRALITSTEQDWQKDPGRYWALASEYRNRIKRIIDQFSE